MNDRGDKVSSDVDIEMKQDGSEFLVHWMR